MFHNNGFARLSLSALAVFAFPRDASACSGIFAMDIPGLDRREVPQNSQVTATYSCRLGTACTPPTVFEVTDSSGSLVSGEVEFGSSSGPAGGGKYFFRPAAPLTIGESYHASVGSVSVGEFTVTEPIATDPNNVQAELEFLAGQRHGGTEVCCDSVHDTCGDPLCFRSELQNVVSIRAVVTMRGPDAGNWRFRIRSWNAEGEQSTEKWDQDALTIDEQQDEYCFQVELESLVDGERVELAPECFPHGDLPDLVVEPASPPPAEVARCPEPPERHEDAWCEGTAELCANGNVPDACPRHHEFCVNPTGSDGGARDAAGHVGDDAATRQRNNSRDDAGPTGSDEAATNDGAADELGGPDLDAYRGRRHASCGLTGQRVLPTGGVLFGLGLLGLAAVRRRSSCRC